MAAADTARLVAQLTLDAKGFTKGLSKANQDLGKLESTAFRVGQNIGQGAKNAANNIAKIGLVAAGGIALAVRGGLQDLATLETAITSVDGAIEQMGLTGTITGKEVAKWANDIEKDIDAAFDDKDITAAAATLLRFGKVVPANLKPALEIVADLAVKTGDVESAASLLAKALADPAKAAGKLAKNGIILTKAQQDTIKAMVEANDIAGAQALILDEVAKSTEGAAKASAGPYQDALNKLADVSEDAKKALAEGFLPVIEKVADRLSTALADEKFVNGLRSFGTELAGGLDDLIGVAEKLPWATIGESLKIAGAGAKAVLTAFTSLPPWVQTAVITGWGLNKLTGGALGGIVSELGKGLVKGVLGMTAGTVIIKAGVVQGAGGGGGGAPAAALGGIGLAAGAAATVGVIIVGVQQAVQASLAGAIATAITGDPKKGELVEKVQGGTGSGPLPVLPVVERLMRAFSGDFRSELEIQQDLERQQITATNAIAGNVVSGLSPAKAQQTAAQTLASSERQESIANQNAAKVAAQIAAGDTRTELAIAGSTAAINAAKSIIQIGDTRTEAAIAGAKAVTQTGLERTRAAAQAAAFAIRDKDLSVSVSNTINTAVRVSVRETINTQTTHKQFQRYIQ